MRWPLDWEGRISWSTLEVGRVIEQSGLLSTLSGGGMETLPDVLRAVRSIRVRPVPNRSAVDSLRTKSAHGNGDQKRLDRPDR